MGGTMKKSRKNEFNPEALKNAESFDIDFNENTKSNENINRGSIVWLQVERINRYSPYSLQSPHTFLLMVDTLSDILSPDADKEHEKAIENLENRYKQEKNKYGRRMINQKEPMLIFRYAKEKYRLCLSLITRKFGSRVI